MKETLNARPPVPFSAYTSATTSRVFTPYRLPDTQLLSVILNDTHLILFYCPFGAYV